PRGMRPGSRTLLIALAALGTPACVTTGRLEAASPQTSASDSLAGPPADEGAPEPSGEGPSANPDEGEAYSSGVTTTAPAEGAWIRPENEALITGIGLTTAGALTSAMGGFM